jgi:AcrR family transcriptional regulator
VKSQKRSYRMVARADAAEETRRRILDAAVALYRVRDPDEITLDAIAGRADVTLQTVLRRFGSKDQVFVAAAEAESARIMKARAAQADNPRAAVRALVASYEQMGDLNWRLLRFEAQSDALHRILVGARASHRDWIARALAGHVPARGARRERRLDALHAATDFYVWKLYRRDLGRSRAACEAAMLRLVEAVIGQPAAPSK